MKLGRKTLEGYLSIILVLMTIVTFMILGTISLETNPGISFLNILVILLIGIGILQAILQLRILEKVGEK